MTHLAAAPNEKVFSKRFETIRGNFSLDESDNGTFGPSPPPLDKVWLTSRSDCNTENLLPVPASGPSRTIAGRPKHAETSKAGEELGWPRKQINIQANKSSLSALPMLDGK